MFKHRRRPVSDRDLVQVLPRVRRVARSLAADDAEDVVQETLLRLLASRDRLDSEGLQRYAEVTARNVALSERREQLRERQLREQSAHHLPVATAEQDPFEVAVRGLEYAAVVSALHEFPPAHRELLLANVLDGQSPAVLASTYGGSPQSVSSRLQRTRARLRVLVLLRTCGTELPTRRCLLVLQALSAADRRRQRELGAARHVLACAACAELAPALIERDRRLLGLAPWALAGLSVRRLLPSRSTVARTAHKTVATGVTAVALVALAGDRPPPAPAPPHTTVTATGLGTVHFASGQAALDPAARRTIEVTAARLQTMPGVRVQVTGYSDSTADAATNAVLSQRRADSVAALLRELVGAALPVATASAGEGGAVASNESAGGRAANRRAVIEVVSR